MAAPLVITVIDKSFDITVFYSLNEEESSNGHDTSQQKVIPFFSIIDPTGSVLKLQKKKYHSYYLDRYITYALKTILPPPRFSV